MTVPDATAAATNVDSLRAQATTGTLSLGGFSVMQMTPATQLSSDGPTIVSVTPNVFPSTGGTFVEVLLQSDVGLNQAAVEALRCLFELRRNLPWEADEIAAWKKLI